MLPFEPGYARHLPTHPHKTAHTHATPHSLFSFAHFCCVWSVLVEQEAVVCGNYVRALKESVRLCAEKDKELEREPAQDYDIPLAKRTLFVEPEERMVTVRINTGKGGRQEFSVLESAAKDMDGCD